MGTPGKRPFWIHQAAEYLIGAAFVASGLQSPTPAVPTLLGGLIMINTACSKGPLSAFRVVGKRMHRLFDICLVILILLAAVQPFVEIDNGTRFIMALLAVAVGVIWAQSDFVEHAKKPRRGADSASHAGSSGVRSSGVGSSGVGSSAAMPASAPPRPLPDGTTADTIGRTAGRLAGKGVNLYRARKAATTPKPKPKP